MGVHLFSPKLLTASWPWLLVANLSLVFCRNVLLRLYEKILKGKLVFNLITLPSQYQQRNNTWILINMMIILTMKKYTHWRSYPNLLISFDLGIFVLPFAGGSRQQCTISGLSSIHVSTPGVLYCVDLFVSQEEVRPCGQGLLLAVHRRWCRGPGWMSPGAVFPHWQAK